MSSLGGPTLKKKFTKMKVFNYIKAIALHNSLVPKGFIFFVLKLLWQYSCSLQLLLLTLCSPLKLFSFYLQYLTECV